MSARKPIKTIDQVFEEFLAEQKARLSPRTVRKYDNILHLSRSCLEGYWPGHDQEEYDRITEAGGTFCGTFGPEELPGDAARELPAAQDVVDLLEAYLDEHAPARYSREIEDHFTIMRIEPGKLWLEPFTSGGSRIGPIPVPQEVSRICEEGWDISGVAVKTPKGWRLTEVWNVSP